MRFAVTQLSAGDTLNLRGGTYLETDIYIDGQRTAEDPIAIRNYRGDVPVVDGG